MRQQSSLDQLLPILGPVRVVVVVVVVVGRLQTMNVSTFEGSPLCCFVFPCTVSDPGESAGSLWPYLKNFKFVEVARFPCVPTCVMAVC